MAGLSRIEIRQKEKLEQSERNISEAFQDLRQLKTMGQDMTRLSKSIAAKIKEHGSQVTTDETVLFRSHLMELGIEQQLLGPETSSKSNYSDNVQFYTDLARQLSSIIKPLMERRKQEQLTLSDVYCCFNRARGMDLVSPEDILNACKQLEQLPNLQLRLFQYKSGLLVVQNQSCDNEAVLNKTVELVEKAGSLTPIQLSARLSVSVQLARQRLEEAESVGKLCRDESLEGLKFYTNKFIERCS
jgi:ESCRT-II complex subunit VPS36